MRNSNNITGVTGEYYVCAELGYRGILAIPTPKNNPLFDLFQHVSCLKVRVGKSLRASAATAEPA